jgi:hypothetical protein
MKNILPLPNPRNFGILYLSAHLPYPKQGIEFPCKIGLISIIIA